MFGSENTPSGVTTPVDFAKHFPETTAGKWDARWRARLHTVPAKSFPVPPPIIERRVGTAWNTLSTVTAMGSVLTLAVLDKIPGTYAAVGILALAGVLQLPQWWSAQRTK